jgi:lysozyme family protein
MIAPLDFLKAVIARWEGGYESYADDLGNWVTTPDGRRIDIGTMRGVTPAALAAHRGVPACTLTAADMQAVTLEEAADIGLVHYYQEPHFDQFTWGPATAALLDFGWGAGPGQAARSIQRLIGVTPDGAVGPATIAAYNHWIGTQGWDAATQAVHDMRAAFYRYLAESNPADQRFLDGWLNRDDWASGPQFLQQIEEGTSNG